MIDRRAVRLMQMRVAIPSVVLTTIVADRFQGDQELGATEVQRSPINSTFGRFTHFTTVCVTLRGWSSVKPSFNFMNSVCVLGLCSGVVFLSWSSCAGAVTRTPSTEQRWKN